MKLQGELSQVKFSCIFVTSAAFSAIRQPRRHKRPQETTQPLVLQGVVKWRISGSNRRPFECHAFEWGVVVARYWPLNTWEITRVVHSIACILRMVSVHVVVHGREMGTLMDGGLLLTFAAPSFGLLPSPALGRAVDRPRGGVGLGCERPAAVLALSISWAAIASSTASTIPTLSRHRLAPPTLAFSVLHPWALAVVVGTGAHILQLCCHS